MVQIWSSLVVSGKYVQRITGNSVIVVAYHDFKQPSPEVFKLKTYDLDNLPTARFP
jgi:hypothetical protein